MKERITVRVADDIKQALERFHQQQLIPLGTRQDVYRYIVEDWLRAHGYLKLQESSGSSPSRTNDAG